MNKQLREVKDFNPSLEKGYGTAGANFTSKTDIADHMIVPTYDPSASMNNLLTKPMRFSCMTKADRPFAKNSLMMKQKVKEALFVQKQGYFT